MKPIYRYWQGMSLSAVSRPIEQKPTLQEMQDQLLEGETLVGQYRVLAGRVPSRFIAVMDEATFARWEQPKSANVQEREFFALAPDHGGEFVEL